MTVRSLLVVALLVWPMGCEKDSDSILSGLSQKEANNVLLVLKNNGIDAQKTTDQQRSSTTYGIAVEKNDVSNALKILINHRLPPTHRAGLKDVYVLGASNMIPTKSDEVAKATMASQGEIENLIKTIPSVLDARVVLALPLNYGLVQRKQQKTASVAVIAKSPQKNDSALTREEVAKMVAYAIGLTSVDQVNVIIKHHIDQSVSSLHPPDSSLSLPRRCRDRQRAAGLRR